jgi:hypothetical protein
MKRRIWRHWLAAALLLAAALAAHGTQFTFASVDQGKALVTARDDYVVRMSALERQLKAKSSAPVSEAEFLALLAGSVRPWQADERAGVEQALAALAPRLEELRLPLPPVVVFVRTTGDSEGGAAHTRGAAVMVTDQALREPSQLPFLLAHELFHVASRNDRAWRDALYRVIGFAEIDEVSLPASLAQRRITNPDAPKLDVALRVGTPQGERWVTPLLQATVDRYDAGEGREFFALMQLVWLEVGSAAQPPAPPQVSEPARLFRTSELIGFDEQVGRNTGYIIHPEEILADNYAQLATGRAPRSPDVHARLRQRLQEYQAETRPR